MGLLDGTTQKSYYEGSSFGTYQFISLDNVIDNFMVAYIGEGKIIEKARRTDVAFHAQRALQELSFDTFKSTKAQEIEIPASLQMVLPQDYVNYVKVVWKDSSGIEHTLYPAIKTSNPKAITQDSSGVYQFTGDDLTTTDSDTWTSYKNTNPSENNNDDYQDGTRWRAGGERYGLDPQHSQVNGSFYIDELTGKIHFSSNVSGKTVTLKYISDSLGTDAEMQVHKFAEEAMYSCMAYAVINAKSNVQEYIVNRFRKSKFASVRTAKLRLSNLKLEELTQTLRGKSKQIKH
tara:strand:- start:5289 stop:6158 length:870 start_codon:yes stop_codon:yes gene_type:complete